MTIFITEMISVLDMYRKISGSDTNVLKLSSVHEARLNASNTGYRPKFGLSLNAINMPAMGR